MPPPAPPGPTCYLNGTDWTVAALDRECRAHYGAGLAFQVCLDLAAAPEPAAFARLLASFTAGFPALNGRIGRAWNLAPCWRLPAAAAPPPVATRSCPSKEASYAALETELARPFATEHEHLRFTLASHPEGCLLGALFDHRLFDAKGGEAFLSLLDAHAAGGPPLREAVRLHAPSRLDHWLEKLRCGRQVNRAFIALADESPARILPLPTRPAGGWRRPRSRRVEFTAAQTAAIAARADREAGCLMLMPFLLANAIVAVHRLCQRRGTFPAGGHYLISITGDPRGPEQVTGEVLFNHLSFFLFKTPVAIAADFPCLLATVKEQFYEQVKADFPRALAAASDLMRIVPLPLLNRLMRLHLRGQIPSFSCAYLGASPYQAESFLGIPLRNFVHQPVVPPPGLGLFFQPAGRRLNAILAYADGLISEEEAEAVVAQLRELPGKG